MNNTLAQAFTYGETPVRTVQFEGEPWFCLNDVAACLGIQNPRNHTRSGFWDQEGVKSFNTLTAGGEQSIRYINETNLYALVMRSHKDEAVQFQRWVTHEVLPQIRKTGTYRTPLAIESDPILAVLGAIRETRIHQLELEQKVENVDLRLAKIEADRQDAHEAMLALPAPSVEVRDLTRREQCIEAINTYVKATGIGHQEAWSKVYGKFDLVKRCKLTTLAKNRKMNKMDYVEEAGWIEDMYAVIAKMVDTAKAA